MTTLRWALAHVRVHGFGNNAEADATIEKAAEGLLTVYDDHELGDTSDPPATSGADDAAAFYDVLNSVGMPVA